MSELLNVQTFQQIWKTVIECSNQSVIGSIIQTFITGITIYFAGAIALLGGQSNMEVENQNSP